MKDVFQKGTRPPDKGLSCMLTQLKGSRMFKWNKYVFVKFLKWWYKTENQMSYPIPTNNMSLNHIISDLCLQTQSYSQITWNVLSIFNEVASSYFLHSVRLTTSSALRGNFSPQGKTVPWTSTRSFTLLGAIDTQRCIQSLGTLTAIPKRSICDGVATYAQKRQLRSVIYWFQ